MRDRSVEARQERQPIVQYFTALNSPLPSNRRSTQAFSTLNGFFTQPLSISRYLSILTQIYKGQISEVILYGSAARGESLAESDIDLLIVSV
jgi:hypothetical protein